MGVTIYSEFTAGTNSIEKIHIEQRSSTNVCLEVVIVLTGDAAREDLADGICDFMNGNAVNDPNFFYDPKLKSYRPTAHKKD